MVSEHICMNEMDMLATFTFIVNGHSNYYVESLDC